MSRWIGAVEKLVLIDRVEFNKTCVMIDMSSEEKPDEKDASQEAVIC